MIFSYNENKIRNKIAVILYSGEHFQPHEYDMQLFLGINMLSQFPFYLSLELDYNYLFCTVGCSISNLMNMICSCFYPLICFPNFYFLRKKPVLLTYHDLGLNYISNFQVARFREEVLSLSNRLYSGTLEVQCTYTVPNGNVPIELCIE